MQETQVQSLGQEDLAPHSSTLAWKIPWTDEPGRLQSMGSQRAGHDWETSLSLFTFMHWRRKWQPTPVFLLENPRDGGAWRAAIYGVTQSWTRLKWLSKHKYLFTGIGLWVLRSQELWSGQIKSCTDPSILSFSCIYAMLLPLRNVS